MSLAHHTSELKSAFDEHFLQLMRPAFERGFGAGVQYAVGQMNTGAATNTQDVVTGIEAAWVIYLDRLRQIEAERRS